MCGLSQRRRRVSERDRDPPGTTPERASACRSAASGGQLWVPFRHRSWPSRAACSGRTFVHDESVGSLTVAPMVDGGHVKRECINTIVLRIQPLDGRTCECSCRDDDTVALIRGRMARPTRSAQHGAQQPLPCIWWTGAARRLLLCTSIACMWVLRSSGALEGTEVINGPAGVGH